MQKLLPLAISVALTGLSLLGGDLTITSHITGKGALAKDGSQIEYVSPTRMRVNNDSAKTDTLVDYGNEVMGMNVTTEATAVSTASIPDSVWALPAGYTLKDGGKAMKEGMKGRH